jgi:iron complex transport system substrate-binding protein
MRKMNILLIAVLMMLAVSGATMAQDSVTCETGQRLFEHERLVGEPVCIPEAPARIASLDPFSLETLVAVDTLPVAMVNKPAALSRLPELESTLDEVIDLGQPANLEMLLAAQPDLILTISGAYDDVLDQLRAIAPTVVLQFDNSGEWKDITRAFAEVIDAQDAIEAVFAVYDERLEVLRDLLGEQPPVVSIVRIYPDTINLYLRESYPGTILEDAGIPRPESQDYSMEEAAEQFDNPIQYSISQETLRDADADIIITWTFGATAELAESAEEQLEALLANPLWATLEAVQNGRVYRGGPYWIGSGIYAAHRIIDDLFLYVAEADPTEFAPNPFTASEPEATPEATDTGG